MLYRAIFITLLLFTSSLSRAQEAGHFLEIPAGEEAEEYIPEDNNNDIPPEQRLKKREEKQKTDTPTVKEKPEAAGAENPPPPEAHPEVNTVTIRGLNKVTGRTSTIEIPLGTTARFDNLEIIARKCKKSLPEERPENAALFEIRELKKDESPKQVFFGWMLSSSPAISSLEHPVYDITVISCDYRKSAE